LLFDSLSKIIAANNKELIDKLTELAPIIIIGLLWLFGAIAKAVAEGRKGKETQPQPRPQQPLAKPKQPDFAEFIKTVKEQYTQAKEQVKKQAEEEIYRPPPSGVRPSEKPSLKAIEWTVPQKPQNKPPVKPAPVRMEAVKQKIAKSLIEQPLEDLTKEQLTLEIHADEPHPYLAELAEQFANTDGLRKAILNQEILGKPLALRD